MGVKKPKAKDPFKGFAKAVDSRIRFATRDLDKKIRAAGRSARNTILRFSYHGQRPAALDKPARDLTADEARRIVAYLAIREEITLEKDVDINEDGDLNYPPAGKEVMLKLAPPEIAGVKFHNYKYGYMSKVGPLNAVFIVLLWKMANMLKTRFGVSIVYYGGFGSGKGDSTDTHHSGRAIDFWGAQTPNRKFWVKDDWGKKPFSLDGGATQRTSWPCYTPKKQPGVTVCEKHSQTAFRIDPAVDRDAYNFFLALYEFATKEASDLGATKGPSTIGQGGHIIHPDYPVRWYDHDPKTHDDLQLRKGHQDHLHIEIHK
jgi:hypothetical protein